MTVFLGLLLSAAIELKGREQKTMKDTQRGHHRTRKTRQPLLMCCDAAKVEALRGAGEILEFI